MEAEEMSLTEIIDKLCHVTTVLAELVREQSNVIAQSDLCLLDGKTGSNRITVLQARADVDLDEIKRALREAQGEGERNGSN